MRLGACTTWVALLMLTDLVTRAWWPREWPLVDPCLVGLMWLALYDRRSRVHLLVALVAILRTTFGLDGLLTAWLPLALAVEMVLAMRFFFDLRYARFRFPCVWVVAVTAVIALSLLRGISTNAWTHTWMVAATCTTGAAILAFPIFDALRPVLRSPRHPLR